MNSWKECTLAEITSILGDGLHGTPNYDKNGEYFFINGNNLSNGKIIIKSDTKRADLSEYTKYKKNLNDRTILVSINGTLGNIALYNNEKCILGKSACYFNVNDNVDKYFIKYVVTNKDFQEYIRNFATGTTIPNVSLKTMREYSFSLPPLEEQKAIAEILSSLDDKIDLLHRQNQTLESLAQTLFRQWFIEEAKDEWEIGTVGDIAILKSGKSRPKEESEINDIPIYGGNGILGFTHQYNVDGETIIIGRVGAYCGSLYIENKPIWVSDNALIAKPQNPLYSKYLFYILKENELNSMAEGSSHPLLTQEPIKSIEIFIPPESKLIEFNEQVNTWYEKTNKNKKQIQTLENLRDTLLPKFLSGEVRVKI